MIIARATIGAKEVLVLGLSKRNVEKLLADQPLRIRREVHGEGVPEGWEITIFVGENEDAMAQMLKDGGLIGPDTVVKRDPKLDKA